METVIPALIIIALLVVAAFTIAERALSAQQAVAESWLEMQERAGERARTDLSPVDARTTVSNVVEITIRNDGDTKLADFEQWDVILRYGGTAEWYPYTTTVSADDTWINYIDESIEDNIFNPEEDMVITVTLSTPVGLGTTNTATVATPNGVTTSKVFTR